MDENEVPEASREETKERKRPLSAWKKALFLLLILFVARDLYRILHSRFARPNDSAAAVMFGSSIVAVPPPEGGAKLAIPPLSEENANLHLKAYFAEADKKTENAITYSVFYVPELDDISTMEEFTQWKENMKTVIEGATESDDDAVAGNSTAYRVIEDADDCLTFCTIETTLQKGRMWRVFFVDSFLRINRKVVNIRVMALAPEGATAPFVLPERDGDFPENSSVAEAVKKLFAWRNAIVEANEKAPFNQFKEMDVETMDRLVKDGIPEK